MRAKITADHLERTALVYVRQSTPGQVRDHTESRRRQYGLVDVARELGFHRVETSSFGGDAVNRSLELLSV